MGVPLVAQHVTRRIGERRCGRDGYEGRLIARLAPLSRWGLRFTMAILFALPGGALVHRPWAVVRIAVALLIYLAFPWSASMDFGYRSRLGSAHAVTLAFTAVGNNFELAIAVATGTFGAISGQALAGVVGPLIEVPALIALASGATSARRWFTSPVAR